MTKNAAELGTRASTLTALATRLGLPTPRAGHWMKLEEGKAPPTPAYPADANLDEAAYPIVRATDLALRHVSNPRRREPGPADTLDEPGSPGRTSAEAIALAPTAHEAVLPSTETVVGPRKELLATRKALAKSRGLDRVAVGGLGKFRLLVTPDAGDRACALLDQLITAIEERGWKPESTDEGFAILADGEAVGLMIEEKLEEVVHVPTERELKEQAEYDRKCALADRGIGHRPWRAPSIPKFDFIPGGDLALKFDQNYAAEGIRRTFADGKKQRLDHLVPSILVSIERYASAVKARREQQEEQSRRWADQERKRKDAERQARVEGYRVAFLRRQIERKREIDGLADLIAHWEPGDGTDPMFDELLDFARLYRGWLAAKIAPEAIAKRISDLKLMDDDIYISTRSASTEAPQTTRRPKAGFRTLAPSRSRASSSDQNCISVTRSSQYSPRV